jgi:hypothetical protein
MHSGLWDNWIWTLTPLVIAIDGNKCISQSIKTRHDCSIKIRKLLSYCWTDGMTEERSESSLQPNKRDSSPPTTKRKRQKKTSSSHAGSESPDSVNEIDSSGWALEFKQLEQVFRSLNTVYTFCCTRKHFPTTFDNLKSSVENLTRRFQSWPFFGC